jgi:quinol monooxygenase YgiN
MRAAMSFAGFASQGLRRHSRHGRGSAAVIFIELIFDAAPGERQNVTELARRTTVATHQESGCILYRSTTDLDRPDRFVLTELWESEEHLKAHFAKEAFKDFWANLPEGGSFVSSSSWEGPLVPYSPPRPAQ